MSRSQETGVSTMSWPLGQAGGRSCKVYIRVLLLHFPFLPSPLYVHSGAVHYSLAVHDKCELTWAHTRQEGDCCSVVETCLR